MVYFFLIVCNFVFIFFKSFQVRNVTNGRPVSAGVTSYILAIPEVIMIGLIAALFVEAKENLPYTILAVGTGGALGSISAIFIHKWLFEKFDAFLYKRGNKNAD